MISKIINWIFDIIFGIKPQERKDIKQIKDMSIDEKEAYIKELESKVVK